MQTGTKLTVIFVYIQYLSPLQGYFINQKYIPINISSRWDILQLWKSEIFITKSTSLNSKAPAERHIKSLPFQLFDYTSKIINLDLLIFCTIRHSTDKTDSLNLFATILRLRDYFLSN